MSVQLSDQLCACGCGQHTRLAPRTCRRDGWVKGEPLRYLAGHHGRRPGRPLRPLRPAGERWSIEERGYVTPCRVWLGCVNSKGYGVRGVDGRRVLVHRHAYEQAHGPIPDGLVVDHLCRVRECFNADHLEAVTPTVNTQRSHSPLSSIDVQRIRESRRSAAALAAAHGVSRSCIYGIRSGKRWLPDGGGGAVDASVVLFDPSAQLGDELCELSIVVEEDGALRVSILRDDDEELEVVTRRRLELPAASSSEVAA